MSTVERERKYLVAGRPELATPGATLRQGYLAVGQPSVRVREVDRREWILTIKAGSGPVRTEVELPLRQDEFDALWPLTEGRRIEKTRYRIPLGDRTAELDVFAGSLTGLELVEVEFDDDDQMAAFVAPAWFGTDVTDDQRFTNAALAISGGPRTGEDLRPARLPPTAEAQAE
jgi:adenylate cyclase